MTIQQFSQQRLSELRQRLDANLTGFSSRAGADAIHDLRVSIRRLNEALRAFRGVVDKRESKRLRRRLRRYMDLAAEVRNRDIALQLLSDAKVKAGSGLHRKLSGERKQAVAALHEAIRRDA